MVNVMDEKTRDDRDKRFRKLYNADISKDPSSTTAQLVTAIDDMVLQKHSPEAAAEQAASLVMNEVEPEMPFLIILAVCHHAVLQFEDEVATKRVVKFITALANLPDAINNTSETKRATTYHPEVTSGILTFETGDAVVFENGVLWRDLPGWSMMVTEGHQGPEQYLVRHGGKDDEPTATQKWKKFNTFLALFVASPEARATPALTNLSWLGLKTLAVTLESSKDAWNFHADLWIPATEPWMRIAGDELGRVCAVGKKTFPPGDLWKAEGGGEICNTERFKFWERRLAEIQA